MFYMYVSFFCEEYRVFFFIIRFKKRVLDCSYYGFVLEFNYLIVYVVVNCIGRNDNIFEMGCY